MTREQSEAELAEYRRVHEDRDPMVRRALAAGINVRQISLRSGIHRNIVTDIAKNLEQTS